MALTRQNCNFTEWLRAAEEAFGEEIEASYLYFAKAFEAGKTPEQASSEYGPEQARISNGGGSQ